MGFMDNVSAFTKGVSAKAKGNYDVVTLNSQVSGVKREIAALQSQLGEEYLRLHRDDAEEALVGFINAIKEKEVKISELNAQIEATKEATAAVQLTAPVSAAAPANYTGRRCSNCGAPLEDDSVFCGNCGTKNEIVEVSPAPIASGRVCSGCGAPLDADAVFCGKCGTKNEIVVPESVAPEVETAAEAPAEAPVVEEVVVPEPKKCAQCGAVLEDGAMFCGTCGAKQEA